MPSRGPSLLLPPHVDLSWAEGPSPAPLLPCHPDSVPICQGTSPAPFPLCWSPCPGAAGTQRVTVSREWGQDMGTLAVRWGNLVLLPSPQEQGSRRGVRASDSASVGRSGCVETPSWTGDHRTQTQCPQLVPSLQSQRGGEAKAGSHRPSFSEGTARGQEGRRERTPQTGAGTEAPQTK